MTTALWITNIIVIILVISDMLYGRSMAKKMINSYAMECEDANADYCELEARDEEIEKRLCALEEEVKKLKPKRTSKKTTTRKKK